MTQKPYFGFIDESGTLSNDPNQPFFSMGLLLIDDTHRLNLDLKIINNQAIAALDINQSDFEFKFNRITKQNYKFYMRIINRALRYSGIKICVLVLDKNKSNVKNKKHFCSIWSAYISCAKELIEQNVYTEKNCIVLANQITQPNRPWKFFESEVNSLSQVLNTTQLQSDSSILLQLIDIMTGSVAYQFRQVKMGEQRVNASKMEVSNHLMRKLRRRTLAEPFTVNRPIHFSVQEFEL
jgi:hypothetical protein